MFSIVTPVFNKREHLRAAVTSALAQTFADFELILIDDGSTDGSLDTIADLADPRIRILRQPNGGASAARNAGLAAATAPWIAFLDADDLWLPDHLAELDRIRRDHPEARLIGTAFLLSGPDGAFAPPPPHQGKTREVAYFDAVGRGATPLWTSSAAIHRDAYRALGGFNDDPIGQDSEYWARIAFHYPVAVSTRATAVYRRGTPGGIIENARSRWANRPLRSAGDLSSAAALVESRYAAAPLELRPALDLYLDRYVGWCLMNAVANRDIATIRKLPPLYRARPSREHRLLLALAGLPAPLARAAFGLGLRAKALARALRPAGPAASAQEE
jgi:glycosyltransferase involved in cell wall biosynthesis